MNRRNFLYSCTALTILLSGLPAHGQLAMDVYSEAPKVRKALKEANTVEEVLQIAVDWNTVYKDSAKAKDSTYQTDWDKFAKTVTGQIQDELAKEVGEELLAPALKQVAPKLLEAITTVAAYLNALGPIFAFLSAYTPSEIASDAVEIHFMNVQMQEEISAAITRLMGGPAWYSEIEKKIVYDTHLPSLRLP